jgi:hypothetical protein
MTVGGFTDETADPCAYCYWFGSTAKPNQSARYAIDMLERV